MDATRAQAAPDRTYWIPAISFLLHVMEELPRFPEWATRHFGATSMPWFVYSHIPLITAVLVVSSRASRSPAKMWAFLAVTLQLTLFANGIFHLATTILFDEYSPGLATAALLFFPGTLLVLQHALESGQVSRRGACRAAMLATLAMIGVVASLYLEADIEWDLGRGSS
ncbi:HXXEE domain-containing protein [Sandaracinus amylolyticus]|uniref:HXXEE domain-containing protein n=1 Tax=Sandaracinus amylolyticus TaxID=927083 RepID=UPI001F471632|nr:HXXEE domain-containing protein [Sandaracinus amylolyticus]UJR83220.1 Hypothetical protein I5071_52870 [Sandaracinus amylolyticus]